MAWGTERGASLSPLISGPQEQAPRVLPGGRRWGKLEREQRLGCPGYLQNHLPSPPTALPSPGSAQGWSQGAGLLATWEDGKTYPWAETPWQRKPLTFGVLLLPARLVSKAPLWGVLNLKCSFLDPLEPGPLRGANAAKKSGLRAALSTSPRPPTPSLFLWVLAQDSTPVSPSENSGL